MCLSPVGCDAVGPPMGCAWAAATTAAIFACRRGARNPRNPGLRRLLGAAVTPTRRASDARQRAHDNRSTDASVPRRGGKPMEAGPAGLKAQRLLALFAGGWLLLSFPLLSLFEGARTLWGLP